MENKHTPTPWTQTQIMDELYIHDKNGDSSYNVCKMIDRSGGVHHRNADMIIRAVNNHDKLVDALKSIASVYSRTSDPKEAACKAVRIAQETLKNLES